MNQNLEQWNRWKMFQIYQNNYNGIKSNNDAIKSNIYRLVIMYQNLCNVGLRQGGHLSLFLFSLQLFNQMDGFTYPKMQVRDDIFVMLKLCILFYADDTNLMSETASDLQRSLDIFAE